MAGPSRFPVPVRFGAFEVSVDSGELRKYGIRLKISGQAFQVLVLLLENSGRVVAREEIQQKLWPGASFGDFDHGLNAAVNRLREALGDSATEPKFIETLPRRGYRFIGHIAPDLGPDQQSVISSATKQEDSSAWPWLLRRRILLLLTAGVLLSLCTGGYVLWRHPRRPPEQLRVVPFTTYPGFETGPSFSPDGNDMAFSWYRGDGSSTATTTDLYIKQIGNENPVRLTNHEADFLIPSWSPDGRKLAFGMVGKDGNGVYLIPALGGRERRLAEISRNGWQWLVVSWSPDSQWLAFASDSLPDKASAWQSRYRIHLINVESGEERVLPEPAPECVMTIEPAFSRDGKFLASVCVLTVGMNKLYVQALDGKLPRALATIDTSFVVAGLAWSADGRSIIYSTYGTTGRLWRIPANGGGRPEQLPFPHGSENPAVLGSKLAYVQTEYHYDIWSVAVGASTSAPKPFRLISSTWDQANPQISPDGKLVAFDSSRSGNYEIWICNRDGSKPLQLSFFGGPQTGNPRWSPDGRQIVFNSKASGRMESYILRVDGGRPRRLETGTSNALSPFWSKDGRWIYFATEEPMGIWKVPAKGGVAARIASDGSYPQESSDGKRIFYVVGGEKGELWSSSVNGGDTHREQGVPNFANTSSWTLDQKGIYFVDGPPSQNSIRFFNFATKRTEKISDVRGVAFICCGITVDHDNNTLLFSGLDRVEADIMLVDNFH